MAHVEASTQPHPPQVQMALPVLRAEPALVFQRQELLNPPHHYSSSTVPAPIEKDPGSTGISLSY